MPDINLTLILDQILSDIKKSQSKHLTPIGKITVLKTVILSKFIHVFSVLPVSNLFINRLQNVFFSFLWDNKPDKVKRQTVSSDHLKGGLKMINVSAFINSLKVSWVRRIFMDQNVSG